ncbi:MAG: hypothetical protein JKY28_03810 [Sulfurimonas sp.]|nr:hypothetical protein [Sulfurimonas sp.]
MKYTLILLLFLMSLYAKEFSIIIDKPFNESLFDITQDYDRTISAVGFTKEYKQTINQSAIYTNAFDYLSSLSNSNGTQIAFVKVGKNANVLVDKETKMGKFSKAVTLLKTPSNGYFVGGYTLDGSLLIMKLDSNANVIFSKTFGTKNYDRMTNMILLSDGGVLAIGSSTTSRSQSDSLFETGLGLNDIYLTRFSKSGQKLWSKKYGTQYDDRGVDAAQARDGSILLVSTTSYKQNKNITLMRISENGNKIWLKHFKDENKLTPYKLIKLRDNNFLLSLSKRNELNKEQARFIKFNLQGNVLIDKEITTAYSSTIKDIKEYSDGKIIGVGYVKDTYNTDALVMILDDTLSMLHQEHYGNENYDIFNAVTIMHDSKAAVAGLNTSPESQESNMWIAKINRDGTMAQVSTRFENLYTALTHLLSNEIKNKKLRVKEDLTIEFIDSQLLFKVGEYELSTMQKAFITTFCKKLIPFLDENKNSITALEINGHTSSEWGDENFSKGYLNNEKLSMQRSFATLKYIFSAQDMKTKKWLSTIIKGSGLGFSKKIVFDNREYKQKSRRISFKLIL